MFPAKFAREALTKSAVLYRSFFQRHWPRKFPRDSREITRFFREFVPENTARFDFFSRDLPGALGGGWPWALACGVWVGLRAQVGGLGHRPGRLGPGLGGVEPSAAGERGSGAGGMWRQRPKAQVGDTPLYGMTSRKGDSLFVG